MYITINVTIAVAVSVMMKVITKVIVATTPVDSDSESAFLATYVSIHHIN